MDEHTSHELAYKKGYDKGYEDGKRDAVKHGRWVDVALRFNQVKEKCSICGGMAMPTGSTSAQTAVQRWTKRSNNMAQSKTKEEKVAEVPRVCVCVWQGALYGET